jgi:hypothetical protein
MKLVLVVILLATSAFAQNPAPIVQNACGPEKTRFEVTLDPTKHTLAQPEAERATVYFIQDEPGTSVTRVGTVTRIGMDGAWIGAAKRSSWFSVSVPAGEHHFCVNHQTHVLAKATELVHLTAQTGKTYYFRVRYIPPPEAAGYTNLLLDRPDSDQALRLIASYPQATWCPSDTCALK